MNLDTSQIRAERIGERTVAVHFGQVHESRRHAAHDALEAYLIAQQYEAFRLQMIYADCAGAGWGSLAIKVTFEA